MTATAGLPLADTSDMLAVHAVFRNAFNDVPNLIAPVGDADGARVAVVVDYYGTVLELLRHHHNGEDELMTPRLLARIPEQADAIARIANQHTDVHDGLGEAEDSLVTWRGAPTAATRERVVTAVAALESVVVPHLDQEEHEILPLAASCINAAEWGELPAHAMKSYAGDKPWLVLGLVAEQMKPEHRATMEEHMPPPLHEFWLGPGKTLFADFMATLRNP